MFSLLILWFLRLFAPFRELEHAKFELSRRLLLIDVASPPPIGTLARAEQEALHALYKVVPAHVEVLLLPATRSQQLSVGQVGVQIVEGGTCD